MGVAAWWWCLWRGVVIVTAFCRRCRCWVVAFAVCFYSVFYGLAVVCLRCVIYGLVIVGQRFVLRAGSCVLLEGD